MDKIIIYAILCALAIVFWRPILSLVLVLLVLMEWAMSLLG